jgi:hypothetical protein
MRGVGVPASEVSQGVDAMTPTLPHHFPEKVAVFHIRVPPTDFGAPQAEAHVRVGVLHHRLQTCAGNVVDVVDRIEVPQKLGGPNRVRGYQWRIAGRFGRAILRAGPPENWRKLQGTSPEMKRASPCRPRQ